MEKNFYNVHLARHYKIEISDDFISFYKNDKDNRLKEHMKEKNWFTDEMLEYINSTTNKHQ